MTKNLGKDSGNANADESNQIAGVQQDADVLQKHAEITGNPTRHGAAHAELQNRLAKAKQAHAHSGRSLQRKVKKGLAKAFPADGTASADQSGTNVSSDSDGD